MLYIRQMALSLEVTPDPPALLQLPIVLLPGSVFRSLPLRCYLPLGPAGGERRVCLLALLSRGSVPSQSLSQS